MPWLEWVLNGADHTNFFENRVTEYEVAGLKGKWDDVYEASLNKPMSRKEVLCRSCDAVFRIQHNMEEHWYSVKHCPFCGEELNSSDNEDELYDDEDYD